MRTTRIGCTALALALGLAGAASAGNPDPASRKEAVVAAFGQVEVCQGPPNEGGVCVDDAECDTPGNTGPPTGTCSGVRGARLVARGSLTVIADTVLAPVLPLADPFLEGDPAAPCTGCEGQPGRSSYTLLLEFTRNGKRFTFAETYQGVQQDSVSSFDGQLPGGAGIPDWNVGAFETTVVNGFETSPDYKIRFALLPPAASAAIAAALGEPGKVPVVLEAEEVPACTDPAACHHCTASGSDECLVDNTQWSKHSDPSDALASVRQLKIGIGFIDPPPPAP
ncbi:MAG: hypothetical protein OZ948_15525 [Deltaproteobacteria bacterium]|nr:hypothetical protein [Deltaproteobacteria bacterium]